MRLFGRTALFLLFVFGICSVTCCNERDADAKTVRVGLASLRLASDLDSGVARIIGTLEECREEDVSIVCFPETYLPGLRGADRDLPPVDQPAMERAIARIAMSCKANGVAAIVGAEWKSLLGLENRAIVIDDQGQVIGHQTKNQLTPGGESENYVPDGKRRMFDVAGVQFGIAICHEGWALSRNRPLGGCSRRTDRVSASGHRLGPCVPGSAGRLG